MTEENITRNKKDRPVNCPQCSSGSLESQEVEYIGEGVWAELVACLNCNYLLTDEFTTEVNEINIEEYTEDR